MEGFSYFPINVCVGMRFLYYQGVLVLPWE